MARLKASVTERLVSITSFNTLDAREGRFEKYSGLKIFSAIEATTKY